VPGTQLLYFLHVLPPSECDADDGRVVGRLLRDLVEGLPSDVGHAIRTFAYRTAMLRECGFPHIGSMLEALLLADAASDSTPDVGASEPAIIGVEHHPASATAAQATHIGSRLANLIRRQSSVPATTLLAKSVNSDGVLRMIKSTHVWFLPMLETLLLEQLRDRKSRGVKRSTLFSFSWQSSSAIVPEESAKVTSIELATPSRPDSDGGRNCNNSIDKFNDTDVSSNLESVVPSPSV
jgi:hypothetical protein